MLICIAQCLILIQLLAFSLLCNSLISWASSSCLQIACLIIYSGIELVVFLKEFKVI